MRKILVVAIVALIPSVGCHMCATPYDYCSPVVESDHGPDGGGWDESDMARRNVPSQQMAGYPQAQYPQTPYPQMQYSQSQYSQYPQAPTQSASNWNGYNR